MARCAFVVYVLLSHHCSVQRTYETTFYTHLPAHAKAAAAHQQDHEPADGIQPRHYLHGIDSLPVALGYYFYFELGWKKLFLILHFLIL